MRQVLIATDGSPAAEEAVQFGLELAAEQDAAAVFVHVATGANGDGSLERALTLAAERGIHAGTELLAGNPVDEIVAYADSADADVIVIGSRGRGRIAGELLGSVSRGVLQEARRPVLVVPGA